MGDQYLSEGKEYKYDNIGCYEIPPPCNEGYKPS